MSRTVRFGIIGCGEVGRSLSGTDQYNGIGEWHARYIGEIPGLRSESQRGLYHS